MPNWQITSSYEYRFGSIIVQASLDGQQSPVYQIPIREVIKHMPRHEIMECIRMSDDPTLPPDDDIDKWRRLAIREAECAGKVVLDVGGYDGWAAKLALECGAARAICLDNEQYHHYGWEDKRLEGVEYIQGEYDSWLEPVDVVIAYNILYHTHHPWRMLRRLRSIAKEKMLLCTLFRYHDGPWMYVYDPRECNQMDETVYFGPSIKALERLLSHTGWNYEQLGLSYDRVVYSCTPNHDFTENHPEVGD